MVLHLLIHEFGEGLLDQLAAAQVLQGLAQLGLEDDDDGDGADGHRVLQQEVNDHQVGPFAELQGHQQNDDALDQLLGPGFLHQHQHFINDDGDNQDIHDVVDSDILFDVQPRQKLQCLVHGTHSSIESIPVYTKKTFAFEEVIENRFFLVSAPAESATLRVGGSP